MLSVRVSSARWPTGTRRLLPGLRGRRCRVLVRGDHRGADLQDVESPSPFQRFSALVKGVHMHIKGSPLGGVRKITPLTHGQIMRTVESMYVGGFGMMQVRTPVRSGGADRGGDHAATPSLGPFRLCSRRVVSHWRWHKPNLSLQARVVFALTAIAGLRTPFFQYWRWQDVELIKVPMLRGEVMEATDGVLHDRDTQVWPRRLDERACSHPLSSLQPMPIECCVLGCVACSCCLIAPPRHPPWRVMTGVDCADGLCICQPSRRQQVPEPVRDTGTGARPDGAACLALHAGRRQPPRAAGAGDGRL